MLGNSSNQTPIPNQAHKINKNFVQFVVFGKYDFTAEECDEITFKRGDPILVLEKDDEHKDGWWKGKTVDKVVGLFPVEFTTFINIKQINVDGLFEELSGPVTSRKESFGTNASSTYQEVSNGSPRTASSELHTPVMNYIDRDQSTTPKSPTYSHTGRMSFSSASGGITASPQVLHHTIQQTPPHLSIGNTIHNISKEYRNLPPTSWTVENVIDWLEDIGFGAFGQTFLDHQITGAKLLDQTLATLRDLGISQLKDRLKLFNSIVNLKEQYSHLMQPEPENDLSGNSSIMNTSMMNNSMIQNSNIINNSSMMNNSIIVNNSMINDQSQVWRQPSRIYSENYVMEGESEPVLSDSLSVSMIKEANPQRASEYVNSALVESRNNARQITGPTVMRPRLNSIVSRESLQLTNTNFNYYRSSQRANRAPSQSSKSSISSISSFFRRLSLSKPSKKNDFVFEPMFQQADYQGWLWTRFTKNAKWKKRWIILSREKVYFLKEPKHPVNIKHTIQLNIAFSIQPDIHKGKTKYTFNLIDSANQQITYFSADNHLVMMTWINVLVRATTASASRLQPCPEGKQPILNSPSIIPQSPVAVGALQPIYGVGVPQVVASPAPYHYQVQSVVQTPQPLMRSQSIQQAPVYLHQPRNSVATGLTMTPLTQGLSPRIQQAVIGVQSVPTPLQTPVQVQTPLQVQIPTQSRVPTTIVSPQLQPQPQVHPHPQPHPRLRRPSSNSQEMVPPSPLTPLDSTSVSLSQVVEAKEE